MLEFKLLLHTLSFLWSVLLEFLYSHKRQLRKAEPDPELGMAVTPDCPHCSSGKQFSVMPEVQQTQSLSMQSGTSSIPTKISINLPVRTRDRISLNLLKR